MSLRIFNAIALGLVVTGCTDQFPPRTVGVVIACAMAPSAIGLDESCTAYPIDGGLIIVHPDGSFRRLFRVDTGWDSDGAEPVERLSDLSIQIGAARYRLP